MNNDSDEIIRVFIHGFSKLLEFADLSDTDINLDSSIVTNIIERVLTDFNRISKHHDITELDCHKEAGYYTYWICKLRPIHVLNNDAYETNNNFLMVLNEFYALIISASRIQAKYEKEALGSNVSFGANFQKNFLYTLRYRPINADSLSLLYYFMDEYSQNVG